MRRPIVGCTGHRTRVGGMALALMTVCSATLAAPQRNESILSRKHSGAVRGSTSAGARSSEVIVFDDATKARSSAATGGATEAAVFDQPNDSGFGWFMKSDDVLGLGTWATQQIFGNGFVPGNAISSYETLFFSSPLEDPAIGGAGVMTELWDGDPFSVMDTVCTVGGVSAPIPGTRAIFSGIPHDSVTRLRAELPAKVTIGCDRVWTVMTMLDGCRGTWLISGSGGDVFNAPPTMGAGNGLWVFYACEQFGDCATANGYNAGTCCNAPSTPCDHTDGVFECPTGHATFCGDGTADFFVADIDQPGLFESLVSSVFAATDTTMSVVVASVDSPTGGDGLPPGVISQTPQGVVLEKGSHNVWLEVMIGDWDPNDTGVTLRQYQAALDAAAGFSSGSQGTLSPYVGPAACGACDNNGASCFSNTDCAAGTCSGAGTPCYEAFDCPAGQTCDGPALCVETLTGDAACQAALGAGTTCGPSGYFLGSGTCSWIYTDATDPRWALQDAVATIGAVDVSSIDARLGYAVVIGPVDDPVPFPTDGMYAGTLAVHVPADAKGTFTIGLKPFPFSALGGGAGVEIPLLGIVSADITIETGRCCFNLQDLPTGGAGCLDQLMTANSCAQMPGLSRYDAGLTCDDMACGCDPNVPASFDDGDACTDDLCIDGVPVHTPSICDDGLVCTEDLCDPAIGCFNPPLFCDDGLGCTVDFCQEPIGCVSIPVDVDDGIPCTIDTCNEPTGIIKHFPDPDCIPDGQDCWTTSYGTRINLCDCPIPAGFFCPGSEPFSGTIELVSTTGVQDTIIQRLNSMQLPGIGSTATTPLEMTELQLSSVEPLVVVCDGLRAFDVDVTLSDVAPSTGEMTVTKTHSNGGTFTSVLQVVPKFTFTRVDDPTDVRFLDASIAGCPPDEIVTTDAPWVHQLSFSTAPGEICGENFVAGSQADPDTDSSCCVPVCHAAATATHCNVVGVVCPCCPGGGACCDPADPKGCIELTATGRCSNDPAKPCTIPEECSKGGFNVTCLEPGGGAPKCAEQVCTEMGRVYHGDNTDCSDSDGDGIPSVVETGGSGGCCTFEGVACNIGTDPNNPDSDGDGLTDGAEINGGTDPCKSDVIPSGPNCFRTPCGATKLNFSFMMIPADFFGPGSDPFTDVVPLGGGNGSHCTLSGLPCVTDSDCPLAPEDICVQADTIISREEDAVLSGPGSSATIPIELVALNLASCDPITVEYNGGTSTQQWDVAVTLSDAGACSLSQTSCQTDADCQPTETCETTPRGAMTIAKNYANGGIFISSFFVQPILTFTRLSNPGDVRVFDTGAEGVPPVMLESGTPAPWAGDLQVPVSLSCSPKFVPGVVQNPEDPLDICCEPVGHSSGVEGHLHKTGEVCGPCPRGACAVPGGKCKLTEEDQGAGLSAEEVCMLLWKGLAYAGDGTNCDDSDSDGIANVFETADCKGLPGVRVPWDTGTDPNNPDTDGDGILDGEEIARGTDPCVPCLVAAPAVPNPATPDVGFGAMNRHISFLAGQPGLQQAISVVFENLPGDHARFNGLRMWVSEPEEISEAGGTREPTPNFPTFQLSGLGCEPVYRDWHGVCGGCVGGVNDGTSCNGNSDCPGGVCNAECVGGLREGEACSAHGDCLGALFVADEEIVPGASYEVQVVDSSCPPDRDDSFSAPLTLNTSEYGDILGECGVFPCTPPNGAFDIADCLGILGRFASSPISPIKARTDMEPSVLDQTINVTDVLECIRAFVGLDYRFQPGNSRCPEDLWTTWSDGTPDQSYMDVTLPADFFGPGCDAFAGRIEFRGRPIDPSKFGDADTLIRRPFDPVSPDDPPGTQRTVPIELIELSLASTAPITVTCFGEPTEWVVEAELSSVADAPVGSLTAVKTHANGGVFSSELFVEPSLTFTNVADPTRVVRMLKPHGPTKRFLSVDVPFVHQLYSALDVTKSPGAQFIPGVNETIPGDRTSQQSDPFREQEETAPGDEPDYVHTVRTAQPKPHGEVTIEELLSVQPAGGASAVVDTRGFKISTTWKYTKGILKITLKVDGTTIATKDCNCDKTCTLEVASHALKKDAVVRSEMEGCGDKDGNVSVRPWLDVFPDDWADYVCVGSFVVGQNLFGFMPTKAPTWTVLEGKPKVDPDGGSGQIFTIRGTESSTNEKDVKIQYKAEEDDGDIGRAIQRMTAIEIKQTGAPTKELWWFNGENAVNYSERVTLTAEGAQTGTFTWTVTAGTTKINLENNTDSFTVANDNDVDILSTAASATAAVLTKDVKIKLEINGKETCEFSTMVLAPNRLVHLRNDDNASVTWGYESFIHYRIEDQFNRVLPKNVELNEQWTGAVVADAAGMDWRRGAAGSTTVAPADWLDHVQGEIATKTPTPVAPANANAGVKVYHWPGEWRVGSLTVGSGQVVGSALWAGSPTNVWQKYRGRARHE